MIKMLMSHLLPSSVIKKKKLSIAFVLIFALLSITSSASAEGLAVFASPNHLGTGSGPNAIVIADFNRDGKRDIATANRYSDNISILLSTGTGSYNPAVNYAVAASPVGILAADFNGDGKTDLAAAGASISVLLGNGDGTFRAAANYAAGDAPAAIAVGDFNRDGKPDLAVANGGSGNVSILLGNGDATFQTAITYASGNAPSSIAIGDINGDGSLDLVVTNENDATISILNGNGNGTFQAAATTSVRSGPRAVAIVDFDSDGKLDLLVASYGSGWVSHLKGNGNGTFQTILNNGVGNYPTFLATGDFNGDGNVDYIVTRDVSLYNAMIYYGNGKGGTLPWGNGLQVENNGVVAAVADDLNGDGKTDIVVAYAASNKIAVAMNTTVLEPSGTFLVQSEIYPYIYSEAITAADFNKDGSLDLVVADYNDNVHNISLLSGTGDGTFSASITASAAYRSGVATGDFNRDGKIDLAVAHGSNNNISVRFGVGDGTFQPSVYYAAGSYCRALLSTDVNGDGIADLAVANSGSNDVSILLGKEDGSFLAAVSYGAGAGPFDVIARDFDRDGKIDLLVANRGSNAVSVLIGNGDGTFQATAPYVTANAPTAITVGDFNGDGKLDLAAASSYAADVSILMGNGDGTLGPHTDYIAANSSLESIVTGDFNRDGKLDLAVTSSSAHELSILQGNGDGTFTRGQDMVWGSNYIRRLTAGDFDKDGRIDLAVTSDDGVMILINADVTPDVFYLYSVTNAERNAEVTSLSITVSGINTSVPISITGGWYSVSTDGGLSFSPYSTTTPSTVTAGDVVRVKQLSSPNFSTMTTTKLTISGKSADFQVTTRAARTTPYPFSFVDQVGVTTSTLVTSNSIIVVGIEAPATIYISGGEYEINGNGMWSSASGTVANNDTVRVRQVSSPLDGTRTDTAVTIGGVSDTFSITTFVPDDQFVFIDQTNVMLSTLITSNSIIVTGISMPTSVAITNGEYEVNGSGVWSSASGTVVYNDVLRVRQVSSPVGGTRTDTTLTIGGVSDTFSVTTLVPDTIPDPFAFAGQTNVTVDTLITSNSITVSGLEAAAPVTITDGEYEVNGNGIWSSASGTVVNGNTIRVRQTSSSSYGSTTDTTLTIGGIYGTFSVTTLPPDTAPDPLVFNEQTNVAIDTMIISNSITVTGINMPALVTIAGGEYEINNSGIWQSAGGTVTNGNTIRVRQMSAPTYGIKTDTSLTVGSISAMFSSVTSQDIDATLMTNLPSPELSGTFVTAISHGIGGSGTYEYKFRLRISGVWTTVQDYSTSNTWVWDTTGYQSGEYMVSVQVRKAGETTAYPVEKSVTYSLYTGGDIYTVAGGVGDGGQAVSAKLANPYSMGKDAFGNMYIADTIGNRIRKIDAATGVISTVAGNGSSGYSGDNGPATSAALSSPVGVALDSSGNIYIVDSNNKRVRKVDAVTGVITTVAGNGSVGYSGDSGPATSAQLNSPAGVAVDSSENIYIADTNNHRIRKVDAITGVITTIAGNGTNGYAGDNAPAIAARLSYPGSVVVDGHGNIYIEDGYSRIRKVDATTGMINTMAGNGTVGYSGDNGVATSAALNNPSGISITSSGDVYIADTFNNRIRKVDATTGVITTIAGTGSSGYSGDNGAAVSASLAYPRGVVADAEGNVVIVDTNNSRIRRVLAATGVISTLAGVGGTYAGDDGPAASALLSGPSTVAVDMIGNIIIADMSNHRIRKIDALTRVITTVAGDGTNGYAGDNGPAVTARLNSPSGVAVDSHGNIYIADTNNNRVRKVDATTGVITTVAGTGSSGYYGNNLPATSAWLSAPRGIALDSAGNIYIADTNNYRIRKVNVTTGVITAVAGSGAYGYFGDNGSATSTGLASPRGLAVDGSGNIYIADTNDNRIRKVDATTGVITTVAGNGASGYSGDNVAATSAAIYMPFGVSVTISGDIYIADTYNHRIRKVDAITGLITTIAGSGTFGFAGDYGPATAANINNPSGVAFDSTGNVYIADMSNSRIRKIVAYDTMPDSFSFIAQTSIAVNTQVMSNTITVTGINSAVAISIAGGEYEVNGSGIWTSATGTVNNGYSVRVRQTSSQNYSTTTTASLTIGSVSAVFNVTTLVPVSSVTLTASPASPRLVNTPVTFTATATGGETSKEYQFAVKDPVSGVMTVLQQYGPSNTFPYTPTAAGTYTIRVYVRNVGSPVSYEAARWFTDSAVTSSPVTTVTLAASPAGPRLVNTPATFTATATGGGESKEYQFAVKDPVSGVMTVIQPYGPSNTFPYTPTAAGMYTIRVYARNVGSPASYEAVQWFTDNVVTSSPVTSVTLAASPAGPRLVNTPVTFTATATGGGTSKEYQFAVKDPASGVMTVLQPYGPSNTFPYTPTDAGTYSIRVYVRNEGSAAVYEAVQWLTDNVLASAPVTRATLSASPLSPRLVNTPVTFTATATDGGESKEYQFAVKDPVSGVMTVIQPYGPSNTFPYTPTNAGTYSIRVYVRNVGSEASFEAARWLTDVVTP